MTKKKTLSLIVILIISGNTFCQEYKKVIEKQFTEYLNSIVAKNFEVSMNYIPEDFFKFVPKEQMILLMQKTFNNPDLEFRLSDPKIIEIKDAELIEGKYYSLITYSNYMNMKFLDNDTIKETEAGHKQRIGLTKLALENNFGKENVKYDQQTDFFEIYSEKKVYAISDNSQLHWKFIVLEKNQKTILEKILPKQLTEKL